MPPTGSPDCHGVGTSVRRCMLHGVRHPDREADHRSRRSGRAAGTAARMIRVPPVSSIWIQSGDGHRPSGVSSGSDPGMRPCLGTPRRSRLPRPRPSGHRRMRMPGASVSLFRHHAERRGRPGRTPADPPIWRRSRPVSEMASGVQNRLIGAAAMPGRPRVCAPRRAGRPARCPLARHSTSVGSRMAVLHRRTGGSQRLTGLEVNWYVTQVVND
jgi:hypothetical protein